MSVGVDWINQEEWEPDGDENYKSYWENFWEAVREDEIEDNYES